MADNKKMPKDSKPEKNTQKKNADKKPNVFSKIKQFFKDVKGESKKIAWQSWSDTVKNTGVVLMVTVVIGAGVWISDLLFRQLIDLIYRLAGTGTAEAGMIMLQNLF
ncbi:MAG: preprotein translocase subunit SecE [Clostridia bacterium]|nr:preprotein translocase subunit SecE [Clostridia bacterium]MBR6479162.1 preprotein translocase subunit SecE [Clostridia bacterium]